MKHMVTLPDGVKVPAIGQGTWFLDERKLALEQEKQALTAGIGAGMTLIDTAEMYGSGKAEELIGRTSRWGVSNFDTDDMEELWSVPNGKNCAVNQVLYHVASRGIEYDLLPWMREHNVPLMAYCPLAQGGDLKRGLYENTVLKQIAKNHQATVSQVLLAFVLHGGDVIAIPRTGKADHALENAAADGVVLTMEELAMIEKEFPAPKRKIWLEMM